MNGMSSARQSRPFLISALAGLGLLTLSVANVLGESRGESHRPDDTIPRSKTEIRQEVRTRSDGVQIRISVRQETEGRPASSERADGGERRPVQTQPVDAPIAPPPASAPLPPMIPVDPPAASVETPVEADVAAPVPSEEVEAAGAPPVELGDPFGPAASAAPLFNPSVADVTPASDTTEDETAADVAAPDTVPVDSAPIDEPLADVPAESVPVAEAPPGLFPTTPPFIELPPVTIPSSATRAPIAPRVFVADILQDVPLPTAKVRMNPDLGLVAVPTWFWLEGYDGRAFGASRRVNIPAEIGDDVSFDDVPRDDPRRRPTAMTVTVTVRPSRYEWSFGDDTRLVTSTLGRPYPQASDVKHTYEFSSLQSPAGFTVGLTIEFAAEYRINGGAAQALPPIRRSYESSYRVQEIQPVLTSR